MPKFEADISCARGLDAEDPLAGFRSRFHIPVHRDGTDVRYFCGNSLGLQPKTVSDYLDQELADWSRLGVEGHFRARNPWMSYHELLTEQTARLVGAEPAEVVVMNSLTVNLHLMMVSFYRPTPERYKVIMESHPFPSDRYAVDSQIRYHGHDPADALILLEPREGESVLRTEDILETIAREGASVALILIGGVSYFTGQAFDMKEISKTGHNAGALVGFDLAHAAGNIELSLHDWDADFAVWCSYKYLNGGPGSTAGCFVHERHAARPSLPRFAGWWGHNKRTRFLMGPEFEPIMGAQGWQLSNPAILPLAALRASMEIFDEAGMHTLRAKSLRLTGYLEFLLDRINNGFDVITPRDPERRGAQLSIRVHENPRDVFEGLNDRGFVCDWREPDIIRVAPVPLYNTFVDVLAFAEEFGKLLREKR